jgi:hypothetical protein
MGCPPPPFQEPPQPARERRASLPAMASVRSSSSDTSGTTQDILRRLELQQYEERLEALLESKLDYFREEVWALRSEAGANGGTGSASTDAGINEVVSLFCTQLQESAARGLDDSQMDTRGELDIQLVKDIVEKTHAEARAMIQQDLDRILRRVEALQSAEVTPINGRNTEAMLEEYHTRTRNTVVDAVAPITARLGSRASANVYPASRASGGSKYCTSVIYLLMLMLTDTFTEILSQREGSKSGEYGLYLCASSFSPPLQKAAAQRKTASK